MRVCFTFKPPLTRSDKPDQREFIIFSGDTVGSIIDDILIIVQKNEGYKGRVKVDETDTTPEFTLDFT
jgi:hypothetical protein